MSGSYLPPPARLSLAERDRRYHSIRAEMEKQGLDALILPANHARWEQMMADTRYVTTIGGFATEALTVFPAAGEVTAYVFNRSNWWKSAQDWVRDVRDGRNAWSSNAIERLRELGISRGKVGLSGLGELLRAPDGLFPYRVVKRLKGEFPGVQFVDATALLQGARAVKSEEEIGCLRGSMAVVDRMIGVMCSEVGPGSTERRLYARMIETLVLNGAEMPSLLILGAGPGIGHGSFVPSDRPIESGDTVVNEVEARYSGYSGQGLCPISIGEPTSEYRDLVTVATVCFERLCQSLIEGVTMAEVVTIFRQTVASEARDRFEPQFPLMNARGLGDDTPSVLGADDLQRLSDVKLQAGMTFVLKPAVRSIASRRSARVGDTVVVTRHGAKRLGKRSLQLVVVK